MKDDAPESNPLIPDSSRELFPQASTLVIFGGAGDLARRKLIPALYNLALDGLLPTQFAVLGFSIEEMSDDGYRDFAREGIERYSRRPLDEESWREFAQHLFYQPGNFGAPESYAALKERLETLEPHFGLHGSRVFYLATPPSFIETCVRGLRDADLVAPADQELPFSRLIVEKPIGRDLPSAREVNRALQECFVEHQLYRIDHYLGKETVQNILAMRFGNSIFEPLWNSKHIEHVQITVAEVEGVGTRGGYYESAGALRDMVQNHILQLLSLVAMEPPWSMKADVIRDRRLDVLECLRPMQAHDVHEHVIRAQYASGFFQGQNAPGYRREERVAADSTTETFVALRLYIDNWRWAGVPIYIRTGKALPKRVSEVAVQFKAVPHMLFNTDTDHPLEPNVLALRIQPDEGLSLRIGTKLPGPKVKIYPVKMDFRYGSTFGDQSPEAYERLLLDVMAGDATLFMRDDAVEASWHWIQPILDAWSGSGERWLPEYPAGSWGPVEADRLIESDGYAWRRL